MNNANNTIDALTNAPGREKTLLVVRLLLEASLGAETTARFSLGSPELIEFEKLDPSPEFQGFGELLLATSTSVGMAGTRRFRVERMAGFIVASWGSQNKKGRLTSIRGVLLDAAVDSDEEHEFVAGTLTAYLGELSSPLRSALNQLNDSSHECIPGVVNSLCRSLFKA